MLPEVRLDNDSFKALIEEYRMQIAGIYPEWTNYNYSDPGMTLVELFAWMKENQQFFMEQLSPEHYKSFFRLMGVTQQKKVPAQIIACCAGHSNQEELVIPKGTVFYAGDIPYTTVEENRISNLRVCGVKARANISDEEIDAFGTINMYPFGKKADPGEKLEIYLNHPLPVGRESLLSVIIREEPERNPVIGFPFELLTKLRYEYYSEEGWKELDKVSDGTKGLLFTGDIAMTVAEPMAEIEEGTYAIRISFVSGRYDREPFITNVGFNFLRLQQVVEADCSRYQEGLYLGEGNGFPSQKILLPYDGVMGDSVEISVEDIFSPGVMKPWKRVEDFSKEGPSSECFVVEESTGEIIFGDGKRGLPPEGRIVLNRACTSLGFAGTAMAGSRIYSADKLGLVVISTQVAGKDTETLEELKARVKTQKENIALSTAGDYETQVLKTPGMVINSCKVLESLSSPTKVTIAVRPGDGKDLLKLSKEMENNIYAHLEGRRMIGTDIRLMSPEYIRVSVDVQLVPSDNNNDFEKTVREVIKKYFREYGSFGDDILYGTLYGMIDSLDCIERVFSISFETDKVSVMKNRSGDLIPPPNGLFMCNDINISY